MSGTLGHLRADMNTSSAEHADNSSDVSERAREYVSPRLTPLGNLRDVLAGGGSQPVDGIAVEDGHGPD